MTAISQLEIIRAEAMERLTQNADFRLVNKLDELISDLQNLEDPAVSDLLGSKQNVSKEISTTAEEYVSAELDEQFEQLSNDFCNNVREETNLNGTSAH